MAGQKRKRGRRGLEHKSTSSKKAHTENLSSPIASESGRRITRSMTTDAARRAVFETGELLENVLVHLPSQDIIVSQRVCRSFKTTIEDSPAIQEKLFIRLRNDHEVWKVQDPFRPSIRLVRTTYSRTNIPKDASDSIYTTVPHSMNQDFCHSYAYRNAEWLAQDIDDEGYLSTQPTELLTSAISHLLNGRDGALLDKIHLTDAPAQRVFAHIGYTFGRGVNYLICDAYNESGITIGEMVRKALDSMEGGRDQLRILTNTYKNPVEVRSDYTCLDIQGMSWPSEELRKAIE